MGTVPMGTALLRTIHSRVVWMSRPVERSMTVSAPHVVAHVSLSTSSAADDVTAEVPMLALIFVRKRVPIAIGSGPGGRRRGTAAVAQLCGAAGVVLDVAPVVDPGAADGRQPLVGVAARTARVVQADRVLGRTERHLGVRHSNV